MKSLKISIIIFITLLGCSSDNLIPQNTWQELNTQLPPYTFTDVDFFNEKFGVLCGSSGVLLKTLDGGNNWEKLDVGINDSFFKIFIIDENKFLTSRIGLYCTKDGGDSFEELGFTSAFGSSILDFHFFDSNNGIIVKSGNLYKTNDGGNTWINTYKEFGFADKLVFPSPMVGYLAGGNNFDNINFGELHKTEDGGNTWNKIDLSSTLKNSRILAISFVSEKDGFLVNTNNELFITHDSAETWSLQSQNLKENFTDMVFISEKNGYAIGSNSIYKTVNRGKNWNKDFTAEGNTFLSSIAISDEKSLFVVGNNGIILKKTNTF